MIHLLIAVAGAAVFYCLVRCLFLDDRVDPVCGVRLKRDGPCELLYQHRRYHFCSEGCRRRFEGDPRYWLARDVRPHRSR